MSKGKNLSPVSEKEEIQGGGVREKFGKYKKSKNTLIVKYKNYNIEVRKEVELKRWTKVR